MVFNLEKYANNGYYGKYFLIFGEVCSYIGEYKNSMGVRCISFHRGNKVDERGWFVCYNIVDGQILDDVNFKHLRSICNLRIANPDINPDNLVKNVR